MRLSLKPDSHIKIVLTGGIVVFGIAIPHTRANCSALSVIILLPSVVRHFFHLYPQLLFPPPPRFRKSLLRHDSPYSNPTCLTALSNVNSADSFFDFCAGKWFLKRDIIQ